MAPVSNAYLELAGQSKAELAAIFAAGGPPDPSALTGCEFRGFNQPQATALLGVRKFIKAFYLDRAGQPFGCNTPVAQNGLQADPAALRRAFSQATGRSPSDRVPASSSWSGVVVAGEQSTDIGAGEWLHKPFDGCARFWHSGAS